MAVCSLIRSVCPTPSCFSSAVLSTPVSQIVLEREKALWNGITRTRSGITRRPSSIHLSNLLEEERGVGRGARETAIAVSATFVRRGPVCVCVYVCPLYTFARTYVYVYWRRLANEEGQAPLTFFNSTRDGQCDIPPPPRFIALLSTLLLCFEDVEREEGSTRSSLAVEERMDDKRTRQGTSRFEHAFTRVSSNALSFQRFDEK